MKISMINLNHDTRLNPRVRLIERGDLAMIMALAEELRHQSPAFSQVALDQSRLFKILGGCVDSNNHKLAAFVYEHRGRILGVCAVFVSEYFFSKQKYVGDLFFLVAPSVRKGLASGRIATSLWNALREWTEIKEIREIRLGESTGLAPEAVDRLYRSWGLTLSTRTYSLLLKN
jgi:hypothetical protein